MHIPEQSDQRLSNKNDSRDAGATCEVVSRPGMRFVTVKSGEQQDVRHVHRV